MIRRFGIWGLILAAGCGPSADDVLTTFLPRFAERYRERLHGEVSVARAVRSTVAGRGGGWRHADVLSAVYGSSAPAPRFVDLEQGVNGSGALLEATLAAAGGHGLDPERYRLSRVRGLTAALKPRARATAEDAPPAPSGGEREALRRRLAAALESGLDGDLDRWLIEALVGRQSPVPRIGKAWARAVHHRRQRAAAGARVELALADGLLSYAEDLSRGKIRWEELRERWRRYKQARKEKRPHAARALDPAADDKAQQSARRRRVGKLLEADLRAVRDRASLARLLARLQPRQPQYAALKRALARYRSIVAAGGWARLRPSARVRPGARAPEVAALKRRLQREGFYRGAIDDSYDDALARAVTEYRQTHQLRNSDRPDAELWRSLNVPARRRMQAIEINLDRWRHSAIGIDPYYVVVNIPDYQLTVFKEGKPLLRSKVVVGRPHGTKCDEQTEREVLAFATPVQSSRIDYLVFSPYWNVTREIKETELDPERGKDPLFYEKHGYELLKPQTPHEWVRELPGPANSLGFVKFIFPNPHDTYVHDTPLKSLFDRPLRAYSHGCMRVQRPRSLAKLLLQGDGQWNDAQFKQLYDDWKSMSFESLQETWDPKRYEKLRERAETLRRRVDLRDPVPIHVEYHTVRVDERDRVHFLLDVYGLDAQRLNPRQARHCVPEKEVARRGFARIPERVELLQRQVLELGECPARATLLLQRLAPAEPGAGPVVKHDWRTRRLIKRLGALATLAQDHAALAERIQQRHAALTEVLERHRGRWDEKFDPRAVGLERLFKALSKMTSEARELCVEVDKRLGAEP